LTPWILRNILFLVLMFMPCWAVGEQAFRFAMTCDSRGDFAPEKNCGDETVGVSPVLATVVASILENHNSNPIGLFLFPGDMMTGFFKRDAPNVAECNRPQLKRWKEAIKPFLDSGITCRVTVGNHELGAATLDQKPRKCGEHSYPYMVDPANIEVFRETLGDLMVGDSGPPSDNGMTYSFDMSGCHFAVLAAYTVFENNSFSNETMSWLADDLAKAKAKGLHIFVVSHPPAFPGGGHLWDSLPFYDPTYQCNYYSGIDRRKERDRFWNLLKHFGVVAYFCGHEHNIQVQNVEGVWHVLCGGLTPKLYPLNGVVEDTKKNAILYDGNFQNPRASINWPWEEGQESYWGWCKVTVEGPQIFMDVYGSTVLPEKTEHINPVKTFQLK
jgi:hypothetical protein